MKLNLFAIRDLKSNVYSQPFFAPHTAQAVRDFTSAVNQDGVYKSYPDDFALCHLGVFDLESGVTDNIDGDFIVARSVLKEV